MLLPGDLVIRYDNCVFCLVETEHTADDKFYAIGLSAQTSWLSRGLLSSLSVDVMLRLDESIL
jgi:hypothetical protein